MTKIEEQLFFYVGNFFAVFTEKNVQDAWRNIFFRFSELVIENGKISWIPLMFFVFNNIFLISFVRGKGK